MCMKMSVMGKINRLTGSAVRFGVYNDSIKASSGWDLNPRHAVMSVKACCRTGRKRLRRTFAAQFACMPRVQIPPGGCLYIVIVDPKSHDESYEMVYIAHQGRFPTPAAM